MKKLPFALLLCLLTGCSFAPAGSSSNPSASIDPLPSSDSPIGSEGGTSQSEKEEPVSSDGPRSSEDPSFPSSSSVMEPRTLEVYAINDFHGQIKKDGNYPGIKVLGSYLKQKKERDGAFLISSGDMFQGSLESNYNRGNLLTDVMNDIHFDAFSLGNHEFDWGKEAIRANKERKGKDGYQTPFLSANLYDFDGTQEGDVQQSDLGGEYVVKVADNGLKVGIIGTIGSAQITSITSQFVGDLTFKNPEPIIKTLSDKLRIEENCDLVILSHHAAQSTLLGGGVTSVSPKSHRKYVDLVLCAHTHTLESETENGVLFTQNNDKGEDLSHVTLTVQPNGDVQTDLETISSSKMQSDSSLDESVCQIVDAYGEVTEPIGEEVLGEAVGSFNYKQEAPNLMASAVLNQALEEGFEVDLAMVNQSRTSFYGGTLTYSGLFEAFPFDNEIYILEASGSDVINEARYNYVARQRKEAFRESGTYKIAVIDYVALHQNKERVYDYFPSGVVLGKLKDGDSPRLYREILAQAIREGMSLNSKDYGFSIPRFNRGNLRSAI